MEQNIELAGLADALGDVRARIRALKAEETALRHAILAARPNGPVTGRGYCLDVRLRTARRFDAKSLPDHIRNEPAYSKVTETRTVVTRPAGGKAASPPASTEEDFDVFERF